MLDSLLLTIKPPEPPQCEAGAAISVPMPTYASVFELIEDMMDIRVQQLAAHINYLKSQLARAEADYESALMSQYFQHAALKEGDLQLAMIHLKSFSILRGKSSESLWVLPDKPLIPFSF